MRRVAVIGGGLAGITAALRCADAGCAVTLLEARPRLGGLTFSFRRDELWVDNGQHVFLRCCIDYRALLDRLGVTALTMLQPRLNIAVHDSNRRARLRRSGLPAPLQLSWSLLRYPWLSTRDRLRCVRAVLALRAVDPRDPATDAVSFGDWLREHGQRPHVIEALWDLVGVATLNAHADDASLALAATVFQIGLLTAADAGDIGWSTIPLQQLHGEAAARSLADAGAAVQTHTKITELAPSAGHEWVVRTATDEHVVDDVILAVDSHAAERLLPVGAVTLPEDWAHNLGSSPIIDVHLVYDRPVLDEPFIAQIGTDAQWVFDRTASSGLSSGGQYLAVSVSAADELIDLPNAQLRERFTEQMAELLPATRQAQLRDFFVTRERHATFRPAPGSARLRPGATTRLPGLYLAGAWTDTGWPATMEGAVRSGNSAAEALLSHTRAHVPETEEV